MAGGVDMKSILVAAIMVAIAGLRVFASVAFAAHDKRALKIVARSV
jgi:hypothetical protein